MDRRTFIATALVSGTSVSAYGLFNKKFPANAKQPTFISAQASEQPVVLITGTSSGIGKASAIAFARQGYHAIPMKMSLLQLK